MKNVAVKVCRAEVGEGLLERRFDLFLNWICRVVGEGFVNVLAIYGGESE